MDFDHLVLNTHLLTAPTYVPGKSIEELRRELGLAEIIKLGSNENAFGPSPKAVAALQNYSREMHLYPSVEVVDLRHKLAETLGDGLTAENIIVGNGSADVILSLAQAFLFAGGETIVCRPAFQMYEVVTSLHGGKCIILEAKDFAYDLQAMADQITLQTKLIFITNPNNPTGLMVNQAEVDAFMARVPPWVLVVFDEAYREFADAPDFPKAIEYVNAGRNVIITRTFSKIYGLAGLRVGYGISTPEIIQYLLHTQPAFHSGRLALLAAMAALDDEAHFQATKQMVIEGRQFLYDCFAELGLNYLPSQANFVMLTDLKKDVMAIDEAMLRRGFIIRPTSPFGLPQNLRITVGTPEQNRRLVQTLHEVLKELNYHEDAN